MPYTPEQVYTILNEYKRQGRGPFIMEVLGTPNSGKTSAIRAFESIIRRIDLHYNFRDKIKVKIIYEAAGKCKLKSKFKPDFDFWTVSETIKQLIEAIDNNYDIIICERGLLDDLCWHNMYLQEKALTKKEFNTIKNYILLDYFVKKVNCVYMMMCDVPTSLARERIEDKLFLKGSIVNEAVLEKYNRSQIEIFKKYSFKFANAEKIDTSAMSESEIITSFQDTLLKCLQSSTNT